MHKTRAYEAKSIFFYLQRLSTIEPSEKTAWNENTSIQFELKISVQEINGDKKIKKLYFH